MVARAHPGEAVAFEGVADLYAATRPRYPAELLDHLPPMAGRRVLELGAGTGIASTFLARAGARLVATDIGPQMLARLRTGLPGVPTLLARAEALPVATGSVDVICGAQMWHWVDPDVAVPEVIRVLRPGGSLCLWWNEVDALDSRWFLEQQRALERFNPRYHRDYRQHDWARPLRDTGAFDDVSAAIVPWSRRIGIDDYLRYLQSKSYVDAIPADGAREAFLDGQRDLMLGVFPDGMITEPFETRIYVATAPRVSS